jgi:hypothetical protein
MADEAILRNKFSEAVDFTCADGAGIPKGSLLTFTDPRTVAIAAANNPVIGIAAREKVANDGRTQIAVYLDGIFDMTDSGSGVTVGQSVAAAGANEVKTAVAADVASETVGIALETAGANEVFQVLLKPGVQTNAFA